MASVSADKLKGCHCCGLVQRVPDLPGQRVECLRCGSPFASAERVRAAHQQVVCLALAALALYVPAVTLPFLRIERLGHSAENSLLSGIVALLAHGHWFVGGVLLVFSLIAPLVKLLALVSLGFVASRLAHHHRALTYRVVEQMGRWGMLDVLFVAVLIAFVKLGELVEFVPRQGIVVFGVFVLLSLAASALWRHHYWWEEELEDPMNATYPTATVGRTRRWSWWWAVPVVAALAATVLLARSYANQGQLVRISFTDGRGIKPGDLLRHRGIAAGVVEDVSLSEDLAGVEVAVRLQTEAAALARQGSRFWIVRPRIDLSGVEGLETVVGSKYLAVLPAPDLAPASSRFVGLEEPPLAELMEPGGLSIVLNAAQTGNLHPGVPLLYRDLRIGGVTRVNLASDGGLTEIHAYVPPHYRHLIRGNTRFWNASGVVWKGGLTGFTLRVGTLETLVRGGIAIAVPPDAGPPAAEGARYLLHDEPEDAWLTWTPVLRAAPRRPAALRVERGLLTWQTSLLGFPRRHERSGWLVALEAGWLGPADVLNPPEAAARNQTVKLAEHTLTASAGAQALGEGIVVLPAENMAGGWPMSQMRVAAVPEDCYLITDAPGQGPLFLAAARMAPTEAGWQVDRQLSLDARWHGAAVVAEGDHALIGLLLVDRAGARVAPIRPSEP